MSAVSGTLTVIRVAAFSPRLFFSKLVVVAFQLNNWLQHFVIYLFCRGKVRTTRSSNPFNLECQG